MEILIPIALIAAGLLLIAAEIYLVPGLNVVGIVGLVLITFAVGYAFSETGTLGGLLALGGSIVAGGVMFWVMWQSGAWNRFVLSTNLGRDRDASQRESEQRARWLGRTGIAVTPLRPAGVAEIDGTRIEVATEGEFIAAGSRVRVVAMDRRRHFVRLDSGDPASGQA